MFEDKVTYTDEEIKLIKDSTIDVKMVHAVKKFFSGTIISDVAQDELNEKYKTEKSNFQKACEMASMSMQKGKIGWQATHQAAQKYNVSAKAIGQELGKRRKK